MISTKRRLQTLLLLSILVIGIIISTLVNYNESAITNSISDPVTQESNPFEKNYTQDNVLDAPIQLTYNDGALDGYNLFLLGKWNTSTNLIEYFLVITDMYGYSLIEKYVGNNFYGICAEFINATTILAGTEQGAALWNYYDDTWVYLNISGHHEYEYNPNSQTFFTLNYYRVEIEDILYQFDYIEEYNETGDLVWSLDTRTFISPDQWCPFGDIWGDARDVTHSNTVYYDADEDIIYYNSRNTNTFYKINHTDSTIIWGVGEYGSFTLYNIEGIQKDALFYHAHAVERVDNNTFILFDNDYHNQEESNYASRIVEITIDTDSMTANESWVWSAPSTYWSIRWGDADRLANGNRLGVFGTESHPGSALSARLVEVNASGNIVWEMSFEKPSGLQYIVYRMERIAFSPLIQFEGELSFAISEIVNVTWSTWYNFRPKVSVIGNYTLYLDGTIYDSGTVQFDSYWRPTMLNFSIGFLSEGNHSLILSVSDEIGHYTNNTINVEVSNFVIHRTGPTHIEYGTLGNITWSGVTISPFVCNITINETLDRQIVWSGENITLELYDMLPGNYYVSLYLFNGSLLVYQDSFWIHIYPREAPVFTTTPEVTSIFLNDRPTLEWNLFDWSASNISLFLDGILSYVTNWQGGTYILSWTIPTLDIGIHNITVQAVDLFSLSSLHSLVFEVIPISPPIIVAWPNDMIVVWGQPTMFHWEVYGGTNWQVLKDSVELYHGDITGTTVDVEIQDWRQEGWRISTYNLTFIASDHVSSSSVNSQIEVIYVFGTPYADAFIADKSEYYIHGENAIGAPDGEFATIYMDYSNGYITLDMGLGEEITDGSSFDFEVITSGGDYIVYVAPSLDVIFTRISGTYYSNSSLDLDGTGLSSVRYVRIQYLSGDDVNVDAIIAINYNSISEDSGSPQIEDLPDVTMLANESIIFLTWNVSDETPWSYKIFVDGDVVVSGVWNGGAIEYLFVRSIQNISNVTLEVEDLFGNVASDTVMIRVQTNNTLFYLGVGLIITVAVIPVVIFLVRKKR